MQVTVVGTGYVGLVTGACLASVGHRVACVDVLADRVAVINRGEVPFHEPGLASAVQDGLEQGRLFATTDLQEAMFGSEVSIIAVGTPPSGEDIDLSYVEAASEQIGRAIRNLDHDHVVAVKSTVPPGTTDTLVRRAVEENAGRPVGQFGLCMNPEFLREGSAINDFMHPDRIVIGQWDERSGRVMEDLYDSFDCPKLHTSPRNAELIKYASNTLLSMMISFSNEFASLCEATPGTDVDVVMDGLHLDKRLSPNLNGGRVAPGILTYLRAGSGFGGSCLPKDLNALRMFAREQQVDMPLLDATIRVNSQRPQQVVNLVEAALGGLNGRSVTLLGLAFKPETDDLRGSPALTMAEVLLHRGATIRAYDPLVSATAQSAIDPRVTLCDSPEVALCNADVAVISTAWPEFAEWDWDALTKIMRNPVILDGRNMLRHVQMPAQVVYLPIGRNNESS